MLRIEKLDVSNVEKYINYLHKAMALEPQMREDCERNGINQYYLIRATNPEADRFYHAFEDAELQEVPLLRKTLKD